MIRSMSVRMMLKSSELFRFMGYEVRLNLDGRDFFIVRGVLGLRLRINVIIWSFLLLILLNYLQICQSCQ